jgi:hypothetical protein
MYGGRNKESEGGRYERSKSDLKEGSKMKLCPGDLEQRYLCLE